MGVRWVRIRNWSKIFNKINIENSQIEVRLLVPQLNIIDKTLKTYGCRLGAEH
jgi:hypothetical protein